jgi:hypothetical protein
LDLGWIVQPVLQKRAGRIRYMHCRGAAALQRRIV